MRNTEINIELRSEILEYSLILENAINDLLLLQFGIFESGKSTKLFGKKQGITFKNKIDLLFDINVLNKDENGEFELLMIFRNKFLHDLECNSFHIIVSDFDNGLKNRFKKFLQKDQDIIDEELCRKACRELFLKNIRTLQTKLKTRRQIIEEKNEVFQLLSNNIIFHVDLFFDLIDELFLILENSELENEKVRNQTELIYKKCIDYISKSHNNSFAEKLNVFLSDNNKINNFFGVSKINQEKLKSHIQSKGKI